MASTVLVKSSVVETLTFVPVEDSAAKCAAASKKVVPGLGAIL